ncbi:MAG: tRNA (adenosine(37)-N6)-dimethylallyltransferase MiaA [Bacteroidaceae bacterium]|nr:tRNA (adenosine(37)-N6)-dimethylallyltransferase MiaA [Bacteroidaceae bacterium]
MKNLLTILGPTACGKTAFAARLAYEMDAEIISADSRQVYRGMDIGTGKDLADYCVEGRHIPYHLIDIAEAGTRYNVYEWQRGFMEAYDGIVSRGRMPILCGGTGMYIESVIKGYEFDGRVFPEFHSLIIGLDISREARREKISQRLRSRLDEGMVDEIRGLIEQGVPTERLIRYGLEYKFVTLYLLGQLKYEEMVSLLEIAIHQFAKRQMTWFRGMEERRGIQIHWLSVEMPVEERIQKVQELWQKQIA